MVVGKCQTCGFVFLLEKDFLIKSFRSSQSCNRTNTQILKITVIRRESGNNMKREGKKLIMMYKGGKAKRRKNAGKGKRVEKEGKGR